MPPTSHHADVRGDADPLGRVLRDALVEGGVVLAGALHGHARLFKPEIFVEGS